MSKIGGDPFANARINPVYTSKADVAAATQVATGNLGGQAIQQAPQAQAPAHQSGIGDKIRSFFGAIGKGFQAFGTMLANTFTRSPQAQAPAQPAHTAQTTASTGAAAAVGAGAAVRPAPKTYASLCEQLFDASSQKVFIKPSDLPPSERNACSYAFVKADAEKAGGNVNAFMRGNTNGSKLTAFAGVQPEAKAVMTAVGNAIGDTPIPLSKSAFGYPKNGDAEAVKSPFVSLQNQPSGFERAAAQAAVAKLDQLMCVAFGTPGDQNSIDAAAARMPQSLCDQLAIIHKAVDDSAAPANIKNDLKLHLSRDAIALRVLNPVGADVVGAMDKANGGVRSESAIGLLQAIKGIQNLVNGVGVGKADEMHAEVLTAGANMKNRWDPTFAAFSAAMVARADGNAVTAAVRDGTQMVTDEAARKAAL